MYLGVAIVIVGAIRLIWSKRKGLKTPLLASAPVLFPYHIPSELLPTSLPSTPNPNLASGFSNTISTNPTSKGFFAYLPVLPVWFDFSTDEAALPQHSRPSSPTMWRTSIEQKNDHRYRSVPSRPHSPSASLHIGMERDNSFGPPQLHSLPPSRSANCSRPTSRSPSPPPGATASLIHQPPSNTATLAAWGVGLFRSKSIEVSKKTHSTRTSPQRSTIPLAIDTKTSATAPSNGAPPNYPNQLSTSDHSFRYPLPSHGDVASSPSLVPHPSPRLSAPPSPRPQRPPADERKVAEKKRGTNEDHEAASDGGRGRIDTAEHLEKEMTGDEEKEGEQQ